MRLADTSARLLLPFVATCPCLAEPMSHTERRFARGRMSFCPLFAGFSSGRPGRMRGMRRSEFNLFALAGLLVAAITGVLLLLTVVNLRVGLGLVAIALACWFAPRVP